MTPSAFRRIVLGLQDVREGSHMGHADFRAANGRIFASLVEDETVANCKLTPDQQADFIGQFPTVFEPASGAWGRSGWTSINLRGADAEEVGAAVTLAWQNIGALAATKTKKGSKRSTGSK